MIVNIRPAAAGDQRTIKAIVRQARIAPFGLDWPRFLVAEMDGRIVGVGQIKPHGDGSRELASLAVIPEYQSQGIGGAIVEALVARENGLLYLTCEHRLEGYYQRFGFRKVERPDHPPHIGRGLRLVNAIFMPLASRMEGRPMHIIAMKRESGIGPTTADG